MTPDPTRPQTKAVHAGWSPDGLTGSITPPIHPSTTFERDADGGYSLGYSYSRAGNPTRAMLERALRELEGGASALAFASGMAATTALVQALRSGDHALISDDIYHGTATMLRDVFPRWNLSVDRVDMSDLDAVRSAVRDETALLWIETPTNPALKIADIAALAEIAERAGAIAAVDNTWATPALQSPLALGAHVSMHSTTKYIGGHSDVVGGALIFAEDGELASRVERIQHLCGAVPSPFDCWLTLRGLRTLSVRMRAHCENAALLAAFLDEHPAVARVHYPGLGHHPQHGLASNQMRAAGGMLSFEIRGDRRAAFDLVSRLRLIRHATSLGGVESLIEHRASIEGPESPTPEGLLRLSVGIESPDDLIEDLGRALDGHPRGG